MTLKELMELRNIGTKARYAEKSIQAAIQQINNEYAEQNQLDDAVKEALDWCRRLKESLEDYFAPKHEGKFK